VYPGLLHAGLGVLRARQSPLDAFAQWRAVRGGAREARRARAKA
jgi:hypothetical protein